MARASKQAYAWQFKSRFRRYAFGWRGSRSAIQRIDEAVSEIKAVARTDRSLAAEGAVVFLERYAEIIDILRTEKFWHYTQWAVKARAARGEKAEAIRYAESCRGPSTPDGFVDRVCEEILLSSGFTDEAYERYGRRANRRGTSLATFRAISKKYPHKPPSEILIDLVADTPGEEGKWFAAAKEAQLYDLAWILRAEAHAIQGRWRALPGTSRSACLRSRWKRVCSPCTGSSRATGSDVTGREVLDVFSHIIRAAETTGTTAGTSQRLKSLVALDAPDGLSDECSDVY